MWRERDRKLNEIIDSTPVESWLITVPKILAIFIVLLLINVAAMVTGLFYEAVEGAHQLGIGAYIDWFIIPAAIEALLIAVLSVFVQALSPNKYVGWGIVFVWFVGGIFLENMGYSNPLYTYAGRPSVPLSDFNGAASFWKGAAVLQLYWALFALILVVAAHLLWPRGTDLAVGLRVRRMRRRLSGVPMALVALAVFGMIATGGFAYYNIKVLNRYVTSDEREKFLADYERAYLKYEKLPQPTLTDVKLDVKLFPEQRRLIVDGRYQLKNTTGAPIRDVHVRKMDQDLDFLKLDVAGAHLVSDDKKFGYRIYRFDTPLQPGATTTLTFRSRIWNRGFRADFTVHRRHRKRDVREQFQLCADHRNEPAEPADRPRQAPAPGASAGASPGQAGRPERDRPKLCRVGLGQGRHHRDHRG